MRPHHLNKSTTLTKENELYYKTSTFSSTQELTSRTLRNRTILCVFEKIRRNRLFCPQRNTQSEVRWQNLWNQAIESSKNAQSRPKGSNSPCVFLPAHGKNIRCCFSQSVKGSNSLKLQVQENFQIMRQRHFYDNNWLLHHLVIPEGRASRFHDDQIAS